MNDIKFPVKMTELCEIIDNSNIVIVPSMVWRYEMSHKQKQFRVCKFIVDMLNGIKIDLQEQKKVETIPVEEKSKEEQIEELRNQRKDIDKKIRKLKARPRGRPKKTFLETLRDIDAIIGLTTYRKRGRPSKVKKVELESAILGNVTAGAEVNSQTTCNGI